jgi:pimeloyl-ACP methyl ester carboxylesterase
VWKTTGDEEVAGGSAWELYEDSPNDLAAWIDYAASPGLDKVILAGHSLGAAKAVYYLSKRQDQRIRGIILASPDLHGHWSSGLVAEAQRLVDAGQGEELLPAIMGAYWYRLSARNVASRSNILSNIYAGDKPHIAQIHCPILAVFGSSGDVGGESELRTIQQNATGASRVETALLAGADHVYTDRERQFAETVVAWIESL